MSELDKTKHEVISTLKSLCARCKDGIEHSCPVQQVSSQIEAISSRAESLGLMMNATSVFLGS